MNIDDDMKTKLQIMIGIMSGSVSIMVFLNKVCELGLFVVFETPKSIFESSLKLLFYIWLAEYTSIQFMNYIK